MKKEYIRDNGVIRNCDRNIAKMNIFEYAIYYIKRKYAWHDLQELAQYFIYCLTGFILSTIYIVFYPITILVKSGFQIMRAKKNIKREQKENEKL